MRTWSLNFVTGVVVITDHFITSCLDTLTFFLSLRLVHYDIFPLRGDQYLKQHSSLAAPRLCLLPQWDRPLASQAQEPDLKSSAVFFLEQPPPLPE